MKSTVVGTGVSSDETVSGIEERETAKDILDNGAGTGDSAALQRLTVLQQRIQENQSASLVALLEMPPQPPQPEQHSLFVPLSGTILLAAIGYRVWKKYKGRA